MLSKEWEWAAKEVKEKGYAARSWSDAPHGSPTPWGVGLEQRPGEPHAKKATTGGHPKPVS